mmetsp:Transcript_6542/g.7123  ORF Transcript_6542/g.7123 Transcript_6542/m.7123 type:complete len:219 (-) Transcript_6542:144-800(-)
MLNPLRFFLLFFLFLNNNDDSTTIVVSAMKVVIAGGTGRLGQTVASQLKDHTVLLLSRNSFLASAPNRVTAEWGYVGQGYLNINPHVTVRDWDGGDMGEIVGCDFVGWQDDALKGADVVVNCVGDYTQQRLMATERIVRESLRLNKQAVQITVSPTSGDSVRTLASGAYTKVEKRIDDCEKMVKENCLYSVCLRLNAGRTNFMNNVEEIVSAIESSSS